MFRLKIFLFSLIFSGAAFSQTPAEADSLFTAGHYEQSYEAYQALLKKRPKDNLYIYRFAQSAYELKDYEKAIENFKKSAAKEPQSYKYLGDYYFTNYLFDEAVEAYSNLLSQYDAETPEHASVAAKLNQAELGKRFLNRVEDIEIIDSIIVDKANFLSEISLPNDIGTIKQQRLHLGTKGDMDNIQYTTQRGARMYLSEYLNENSDLFTSLKLLDNWGEKQPLDDLNTEANENYPFLLLDGVTLYFASDGENSMGGYDIFITRLNTSDNTFLRPENIGMPFNSPYNDYMLMLDEFRNIGWFVSDRYQPEGKVAVYLFSPNKEKRIVRTENRDSLISRARIEEFSLRKINFQEQSASRKSITNQSIPIIFINNNISYSEANDFKSNDARNHYFQAQKLMEEKQVVENELKKLRTAYPTLSGQEQQISGQKILELEKQLRFLPSQIANHEKLMRNAEIGSLVK